MLPNIKYIYLTFNQKLHILFWLPKGHKDVSQYPHFPEIYNPFASNLVGHQGFSLMLPLIQVLYFIPWKVNGNLHFLLSWDPESETVLQIPSS